jgi:hypothetical protein
VAGFGTTSSVEHSGSITRELVSQFNIFYICGMKIWSIFLKVYVL